MKKHHHWLSGQCLSAVVAEVPTWRMRCATSALIVHGRTEWIARSGASLSPPPSGVMASLMSCLHTAGVNASCRCSGGKKGTCTSRCRQACRGRKASTGILSQTLVILSETWEQQQQQARSNQCVCMNTPVPNRYSRGTWATNSPVVTSCATMMATARSIRCRGITRV